MLAPRAIRRLAQHYEGGAKKYGDRNWELGQPVGRYLDSALRHLFAVLEGKDDEDHLAAAAWNVLGAIEMEERIEEGLLPASLKFEVGPPARKFEWESKYDPFNLGSVEVALPDPPHLTTSDNLRTDLPEGCEYDFTLDLYRAPDGTEWAAETLGGRTVYREWVPLKPAETT